MKQHTGLSNYLNEATKQNEENINNVVEIDIDNLVPNPDNFYGMRDIDSLASLIDISKHIDPLEVKEIEDGKYMIMSGHRRRLAILKLLKTRKLINKKVPCIVRSYHASDCLSAEDVEKCALIFSNKGRRDEYTLDEKIREIKELEVIIRKFYDLDKQNKTRQTIKFRDYFASTLNISKSKLQRIISLEKLTVNAKNAVDTGKISETAAAELVGLSKDQQDNYVELLNTNMVQGTVQEIKEIKRKNLEAEKEKNEPDMFENQNSDNSEKDIHNGHLSEQLDNNSDIDNQDTLNEQTKSDNVDNENVDLTSDNSTEYIPKQEQQEIVDDNKDISDKEPKSDDPLKGGEKAAKKWLIETMMPFYKDLLEDAIKKQKKAKNKHDVAVWGVRLSVINLKIVDLNKTINDNR